MNAYDGLLGLIAALVGAVVLVCCVLSWNAMTWQTKHCYRVTYGGIGLCAFALALLPFASAYAGLRPWFLIGMSVGFAFYLVLDRRRIDRFNKGGGGYVG